MGWADEIASTLGMESTPVIAHQLRLAKASGLAESVKAVGVFRIMTEGMKGVAASGEVGFAWHICAEEMKKLEQVLLQLEKAAREGK